MENKQKKNRIIDPAGRIVRRYYVGAAAENNVAADGTARPIALRTCHRLRWT